MFIPWTYQFRFKPVIRSAIVGSTTRVQIILELTAKNFKPNLFNAPLAETSSFSTGFSVRTAIESNVTPIKRTERTHS